MHQLEKVSRIFYGCVTPNHSSVRERSRAEDAMDATGEHEPMDCGLSVAEIDPKYVHNL